MARETNVLAWVCEGERYVFLYDDQSVPALCRRLIQMADDPELSMTWQAAGMLCERAKQRAARNQKK
jgi:hypothetical protein